MSLRIVVGVNGAAGDADALALARRLAPAAAELVAVTVAVTDGHASKNLFHNERSRRQHMIEQASVSSAVCMAGSRS